MSRFSRSEAEADGWVIVHEDENQGMYRAEKYIDGSKVEASGLTEGLLLESISSYNAHRDSIIQPEDGVVDESGVPVDEAGLPVHSVLAPDGEVLTDAEWSQRGVGDVIVDGDERHHYGPTKAAAEADARRQEIAADLENKRKAEPDVGPTEQIEVDTPRDHQLDEVLVVRKGEESLDDVIDRKVEESANAESDRVDAGLGIGPVDLQPDPENEDELVPVPMGGEPAEFDPSELPGGVDSAEQVVETRQEAEVEKATEMRDELGPESDSPEHAGEVAVAGSEALQEAKDEAEDNQPEADAPENTEEQVSDDNEQHVDLDPGESVEVEAKSQEDDISATPAAEELAKEKGVDLSQVEGSGKDGKITKPDVESVLEEDQA